MEGFENLTQEQRELCENYAKAKAEHNGWTNYATWRVNSEVLERYIDDLAKDVRMHAEPADDVVALAYHLKEYTEEFTETAFTAGTILQGWANAFVSEVNFMEIARNAVDSYPNLIKPETAETE